MLKLKTLSRILAPMAVMALAACQTTLPTGDSVTPPVAQTTPAVSEPQVEVSTETPLPEQQMAAPMLVFLADVQPHNDWAEVQIDSTNTLYMEPNAFLTREDLSSIEAGSAETGEGLLALTLTESATQRLSTITAQNLGKRLALVVDGTLLAIPGFSEPITEGRLIFMVGTKENAIIAAQIIAGQNAQPLP